MLRAAALGALLAAACSCAATSTACATAHYPGAMMNNPLLDVDQNQFTSRSAGPSNPNLKHMAFWDDDPATTHNITNFSFRTGNVTEIVQLHSEFGLQSLYATESIFLTRGSTGLVLRPDYEAAWAAAVPVARELLANGTIFGFFLGDELVWNCLPVADLNTYAAAVRASFPRGAPGSGAAILWQNEASFISGADRVNSCKQPNPSYRIPSELDWFSVDIYHMNGPVPGWVDAGPRAYYEKVIFPNLTSSQRAALVPGSFGSHVNRDTNNSQYDVMCADDARDFYAWAQADDRIAAIAVWNWGGCAGCNGSRWTPPHTCCMDEIGTRDQPLARAAWSDIGQQIIAQAARLQ